MSLQTWEEEFYPEPAEAAAKRGEAVAVEHSLRKWEGLKEENLARHGLLESSHSISEAKTDQHLEISSVTCALCLMTGVSCRPCPLYKARGGSACDRRRFDEVKAPWYAWTDDRDPEPMIFWLTKAKEHCND